MVGWPFQREKGGCSVQRALWGQGLDLCTGGGVGGVVLVLVALVLSGEKVDLFLNHPIQSHCDVQRGEQTSFDMQREYTLSDVKK